MRRPPWLLRSTAKRKKKERRSDDDDDDDARRWRKEEGEEALSLSRSLELQRTLSVRSSCSLSRTRARVSSLPLLAGKEKEKRGGKREKEEERRKGIDCKKMKKRSTEFFFHSSSFSTQRSNSTLLSFDESKKKKKNSPFFSYLFSSSTTMSSAFSKLLKSMGKEADAPAAPAPVAAEVREESRDVQIANALFFFSISRPPPSFLLSTNLQSITIQPSPDPADSSDHGGSTKGMATVGGSSSSLQSAGNGKATTSTSTAPDTIESRLLRSADALASEFSCWYGWKRLLSIR